MERYERDLHRADRLHSNLLGFALLGEAITKKVTCQAPKILCRACVYNPRLESKHPRVLGISIGWYLDQF
jgi:hypothetical protein